MVLSASSLPSSAAMAASASAEASATPPVSAQRKSRMPGRQGEHSAWRQYTTRRGGPPGHLAGLKHLSPTPLCPLPHVSTLPLCPSSLARTHPCALTFPGKSDETEAPRLAAGVLAHGAIHNGSVLAERLTQFRCLRTEAVGRGWERGRRGSEFVSTAVCPHIPEDSTRFEARLLKMAAHYPKK